MKDTITLFPQDIDSRFFFQDVCIEKIKLLNTYLTYLNSRQYSLASNYLNRSGLDYHGAWLYNKLENRLVALGEYVLNKLGWTIVNNDTFGAIEVTESNINSLQTHFVEELSVGMFVLDESDFFLNYVQKNEPTEFNQDETIIWINDGNGDEDIDIDWLKYITYTVEGTQETETGIIYITAIDWEAMAKDGIELDGITIPSVINKYHVVLCCE